MTAPLPDVDIDGLLESGFTGGDWYGGNPDAWSVDNYSLSHTSYSAIKANDMVIAMAIGSDDEHTDEHVLANRKLMIAAPSLLHLAKTQRDQIAALEARVAELS